MYIGICYACVDVCVNVHMCVWIWRSVVEVCVFLYVFPHAILLNRLAYKLKLFGWVGCLVR